MITAASAPECDQVDASPGVMPPLAMCSASVTSAASASLPPLSARSTSLALFSTRSFRSASAGACCGIAADEDVDDEVRACDAVSEDCDGDSVGIDGTLLRPAANVGELSASSGDSCAFGPSSPSRSAGKSSIAASDGGLRLPSILSRCASTGALGRGGNVAARAHLRLNVTSHVPGTSVVLELAQGELQRGSTGLPEVLTEGKTEAVELRSASAVVGVLRVSDSPPIPFGVQVKPSAPSRSNSFAAAGALGGRGPELVNFVSNEVRQRCVVAHAFGPLEAGSGMDATGDGIVIDAAIGPGSHAEMHVTVRKAKKKEITRLAQEQALINAMEQRKYSTLISQIARSRMRKVETALIDQAGRVLKSIKMPDVLFMSHKELSKLMSWKRVTVAAGTSDETSPCSAGADCPCNAGQAEFGEVCDVTNGMIDRALAGVAPTHMSADKWLFKALVKAALVAPEGCVWKSGGKFILSNEDRNQSASAIVNVLEREGSDCDAGKAMRALVAFTEEEYRFRVTAIQLNFHPNNKSSHKQHRDIYGAGQKGGINCTCSFMKCTGTVCYSIGSSRQVLTETITDSRSKYTPCGDDCTGSKTFHWLHSGSAMFFNAPFNNNHLHGVPPMEEASGPRISIALLCA